jgi:iron-sulfur cluster assembly protein
MGITLTAAASEELARILKQDDMGESVFLRLSIRGGGCSGFNYHLALENVPVEELDQIFPADPVNIVCDPKSFLYLNGTVVDFESGLMGKGFVFKNPNAAKSCGCGESFSV